VQLAQPVVTLKTPGGYQVSNPAGTDEVVIQLNAVEVMRIKLGTNMTIKSLGSLSIEAQNITLKADNAVTIQSGMNMNLKVGGQADLRAVSRMTVTTPTFDVNGGALEVT